MFSTAIVRIPGKSLIDGLTDSKHLGVPDYVNAINQHKSYIKALQFCGLEVTILEPCEEYPDSTFPTLDEGRYAGVIGVGGLVLARIPEELARQREAYFDKRTADRNEALENDVLKEQHPSMPINQDRQTRVTFGGTKKN